MHPSYHCPERKSKTRSRSPLLPLCVEVEGKEVKDLTCEGGPGRSQVCIARLLLSSFGS